MLLIRDREGRQGAVEVLNRSAISSKEMDIYIDGPKSVTVVIEGPDGQPMGGLQVGLSAMYGSYSETAGSAATNADGEVAFDGLWKGGVYAVHVKADGLTAPSSEFRVEGEGWTGTVEISLEPAVRTQSGIVVDADGKPVAKATVYPMVLNGSYAITDAEGRFELKGLPNVPVEIRAAGLYARGKATASPQTAEVVVRLDGCD